jgi:hypothetical protein
VSEGETREARDKRSDVRVAGAEAWRVPADRTRFELDEPDWEQFVKLLDRPAAVPKGLRSLFSKPSVFESAAPKRSASNPPPPTPCTGSC